MRILEIMPRPSLNRFIDFHASVDLNPCIPSPRSCASTCLLYVSYFCIDEVIRELLLVLLYEQRVHRFLTVSMYMGPQ